MQTDQWLGPGDEVERAEEGFQTLPQQRGRLHQDLPGVVEETGHGPPSGPHRQPPCVPRVAREGFVIVVVGGEENHIFRVPRVEIHREEIFIEGARVYASDGPSCFARKILVVYDPVVPVGEVKLRDVARGRHPDAETTVGDDGQEKGGGQALLAVAPTAAKSVTFATRVDQKLAAGAVFTWT